MNNTAKIKEIFSSIQGEGLFIGTKQLFIRFCNCNLKCNYCDTDFSSSNNTKNPVFLEFNAEELNNYIKNNFNLNEIHYISLTGGEPLLWIDFLQDFLPKIKTKIYLETNATITNNLDKILPYVDIISADIKLPSCSGIKNSFEMHNNFFNTIKTYRTECAVLKQYNCDNRNIFAKIVFDNSINSNEIEKCINLAKEYNLELILQPKMINNKPFISTADIIKIFNKFNSQYTKIRLIPQVHKFLDIE